MLIKDLPEDLKKLALDNAEFSTGERQANIDLRLAFNLEESTEGGTFWTLVNNGEFKEARAILKKKEESCKNPLTPEDSYESGSGSKSEFAHIAEETFPEEEEKKVRVFEGGSKRDVDDHKPLVNHLDAYVRLRFGYRLRDGANKYDKGNWRKLQPDEAALESLNRHLAYYELNMQNGVEQDEDHLAGIIFNVMLLMKNEEKRGIKPDQYFKTTK